VFGLYGKEDGLFSDNQIYTLGNLIDKKNIKYLEHTAHSVFIDQQTSFINTLKKWLE
jgi:proline iminopeptidase